MTSIWQIPWANGKYKWKKWNFKLPFFGAIDLKMPFVYADFLHQTSGFPLKKLKFWILNGHFSILSQSYVQKILKKDQKLLLSRS